MAYHPRPLFIDGARGRLFGVFFPSTVRPRGSYLYLPPFAEEMNRCRALAAEQARRFAQIGVQSLLLDPFGTGESEGGLEEASWEQWADDARQAARWLQAETGGQPGLWGMRLGALLASQLLAETPQAFSRLLLWQPVTSGKQFMTQYLRLRVAWLMERGQKGETTESIRADLASGSVVEVAGYPLSGTLVAGIDQARFPQAPAALGGCRIDWFEHAATRDKPLSIAASKAVAELEACHATVATRIFTGPPVWQLHERDEMPSLIDDTLALLGDSE